MRVSLLRVIVDQDQLDGQIFYEAVVYSRDGRFHRTLRDRNFNHTGGLGRERAAFGPERAPRPESEYLGYYQAIEEWIQRLTPELAHSLLAVNVNRLLEKLGR